ncbi:MAG: sigma-70 family RNA polymerase sigma factor [Saprospiraceae bacterium]
MTTTDYLTGILQGDPVVLRQLFKTTFPLISKMIREQGGAEEDARDVFQEATVVIYSKAQSPDFSIQFQFDTYFTAVCRNLWRNRQTKKSASHVTINEDIKLLAGSDNLELDYLTLERQQVFDAAFIQLGPDCQKLLRLFFEKTPMSEIAQLMDYASEGYARRRKFQCKDYLVDLVRNQPQYLELIHQ